MADDDTPFLLTPRASSRRNNSFSPIPVGLARPNLDAAAQQAAFESEHPMASAGSFTPTDPAAAGASGRSLDATQQQALFTAKMGRSTMQNFTPSAMPAQAPGLYSGATPANGQGTGLANIMTPGLYNGGAVPSSTTYKMNNGVPQIASMTMRGPTAGQPTADPMGGDPELSPVLTAALGLAQMKEDATTRDTITNLARAGAIPHIDDSPEVRANKFAYLTKRVNEQGAQALGLATEGPRAAGSPVYTGNKPGAPDPNAHAGLAEAMATVAARMQQQSGQGRYEEDPVSGERKFILGKSVSSSGANPANSTKETYPHTIDVGGRKLIKVSADRFADEQGNPVEWKSNVRKPLTRQDFFSSPATSGKYGNDYGKYREAEDIAAEAGQNTAGGTPAAPAAAKPGVLYPHTDVQAELRKRGLLK